MSWFVSGASVEVVVRPVVADRTLLCVQCYVTLMYVLHTCNTVVVLLQYLNILILNKKI